MKVNVEMHGNTIKMSLHQGQCHRRAENDQPPKSYLLSGGGVVSVH